MTQSIQSLGFHFGESKTACSSRLVRFTLSPNAFVPLHLSITARQQIGAKPSLISPNFLSNFAGVVGRVPIRKQKNRFFPPIYDPIQKPVDYALIHSICFDPRPHSTSPVQHPNPCSADFARPSYRRPRSDLRFSFFNFVDNRRTFLVDQLSHPLGIFLVGLPQLLWSVIPHCGNKQAPNWRSNESQTVEKSDVKQCNTLHKLSKEPERR